MANRHLTRKRPIAREVTLRLTVLTLSVLWVFSMAGSTALAAEPTVNLRTAGQFAILAGSLISDSPTSAITGNVGLSPATGAAIGLLCTQVSGTIYEVNAAGAPCFVTNPALLTNAKNDLTTAYNDAAGRDCPAANNLTGSDLGTVGTLSPGVYCFSSSALLTGTLTLDCEGVPDAVFIFQIGTQLTTATSSSVVLTRCPGGTDCNIFWQVGSLAALGTSSTFRGTILANQAITLGDSVTVYGRLLARIAEVTLINDTILRPTCQTTTTTTTSGNGTAITTTTGTGGGSETTTTTTGTGGGSETTTTTTTSSTTPVIPTPTPFQGAMDQPPGPRASGSALASLGIIFLAVGLIFFGVAPWKRRVRKIRTTGR